MAKPALVVVDHEDASREALSRELESRYGAHYQVVSAASPEGALARLEELRTEGAAVPLVLAGQRMPGMTGGQVPGAGKGRDSHSAARAADLLG
jgi:thioredoxin reductase (NADPH)